MAARVRRRQSDGFTLIELLVVMAITGILIAMAVPSFQQWIAGSQISNVTNSLMGGLQRARSEAISTRSLTGICRSANANAASPSCSNGSSGVYNSRDWAVGYIVYRKGDGVTGRDYDSGTDTLIYRQSDQSPNGARAAAVSLNVTTINFSQDGLWVDPQGGSPPAPFNFQIDYRSASSATAFTAGDAFVNNRGRCIAINQLGRADLKKAC